MTQQPPTPTICIHRQKRGQCHTCETEALQRRTEGIQKVRQALHNRPQDPYQGEGENE